jgi:guanosine-3',5'-bis(diphosphate) 3'-pyrophosphohydrolase
MNVAAVTPAGPARTAMKRKKSMTNPAALLEAASFAAWKHREQHRKDAEGSPYINHPLAVANVLASEGAVTDEVLLLAALLHDTVEDTETTFEELESRFGVEVRRLVEEVTDDKRLPKAARKQLQIEHARTASAAARQLKIADKTCNIRDIKHNPPTGWSAERKTEYLAWACAVVEGCRGVNGKLERAFDEAVEAARQRLGLDGAGGT